MGSSLWVLVDRYDATLSLVRGHVARLRELPTPPWSLWAWELVMHDLEVMRAEAALGAEKCEGRRAS